MINVKNLTVLIMPHCLLTNMKTCITLLDMMNSHSVPFLVKNIDDVKSHCIVPDVDSDCDNYNS